ncbi:MAG TPA: hypothetical protein VES67_01175 [Vicinamibacterales bacterium]|nr:hypothetical protein [Vicinamibacterales bacterium]
MSEIHDCVAAFVDGEPIDPEQLDRALADAEGRAYLIDLLVLRGLYGRRAPLTTIPDVPEPPARPARLRWVPAAAAVVVLSVLGGYVAGRQSGERPPAPDVGPLRTQTEITITAPAPTQVIRLEPGVDWRERGGGG